MMIFIDMGESILLNEMMILILVIFTKSYHNAMPRLSLDAYDAGQRYLHARDACHY